MHKNMVTRILARVKKELSFSANGQTLSRIKGEGFDFAELVPYVEGMDARKIHWNSLAKGGELQLKSFYEERRVNVVVAVLLSGSQRFGEPVEKYEKMLEAAAFTALSAVRSGNLFQGIGFSEKGDIYMPPSRSAAAADKFVTSLAAVDPLYTTIDPVRTVEALFQVVRQKSLIFLISDFLEMYDLKRLARKHEVAALIVRDRFENDPHALGDVLLQDPETGLETELWFDRKSAEAYANAYKKHDETLLNHFRSCGVSWDYIYTDKSVVSSLSL